MPTLFMDKSKQKKLSNINQLPFDTKHDVSEPNYGTILQNHLDSIWSDMVMTKNFSARSHMNSDC